MRIERFKELTLAFSSFVSLVLDRANCTSQSFFDRSAVGGTSKRVPGLIQ